MRRLESAHSEGNAADSDLGFEWKGVVQNPCAQSAEALAHMVHLRQSRASGVHGDRRLRRKRTRGEQGRGVIREKCAQEDRDVSIAGVWLLATYGSYEPAVSSYPVGAWRSPLSAASHSPTCSRQAIPLKISALSPPFTAAQSRSRNARPERVGDAYLNDDKGRFEMFDLAAI